MRKYAATPILTGLALFAAGPLSSSDAKAQSVADSADQITEIVVTAQKREQRVQDIPISVSAISGDEIERAGARDFHDLLLSIPGVSYSGAEPGQSKYSIRGISTAASSPTVGIYLDDVSLITIGTSFAGAADPMLVDLDRVEVLKGPQGTLYGGSAMGGAIKYVSRQPAMNRFSVMAEGGVASVAHGGVSYSAESFVNLPLIDDRLAVRIGGAYRLDAGYVDNVPGGQVQVWSKSATTPPAAFAPVTYASPSSFARENWNQRRTSTARMSVKWAPTDSLTLLPSATIQRSNKANPDDFFTNLPKFENTVRFNEPTRDDLGVYSLNITQQLPGIGFTSLSGYVDRSVEWDRDYSLFIAGLVPPLLSHNSYNASNTTSRTFTQELRLASSDPQASFKWVVGIYYSHQRDDLFQVVNTVGAGALFGTGTDITYSGDQLTYTSQEAAFADVTYSLNRQWDVSAGLRWFDIKQKIDGMFNGVLNGGHSEVDGKRSTDVGVTPKFSLSYRPLDNHLLYGSASKGFRQGGPNRFNTSSPLCGPDFARLGITRAPDSYQPDSLWTYELGSKNEIGQKRSVINAAIYYTDWKKIQQQVNLTSCGFQFVGNVGAATVKGAELSAESALGSGVSVGGTASYTATRITESSPGVSATVGQEVLDTPKWMGSLYGDYRFLNSGQWTGSFRAEFQYHGANLRQFESMQSVTYPNGSLGQIPDATQAQAAYRVVNTNFNFVSGPMQYRLYVDNLTDAAPYLDFRRASGVSSATTLRPRTIGISVKTTF
jgi:outer membrane receptor protein involved in Fe transport